MGFCAFVGPTLGSPNHHAPLGCCLGTDFFIHTQALPRGLDVHIHLSHLEKTLLTRARSSPVHPVAPLRLR